VKVKEKSKVGKRYESKNENGKQQMESENGSENGKRKWK
jgi:hypothetical protein